MSLSNGWDLIDSPSSPSQLLLAFPCLGAQDRLSISPCSMTRMTQKGKLRQVMKAAASFYIVQIPRTSNWPTAERVTAAGKSFALYHRAHSQVPAMSPQSFFFFSYKAWFLELKEKMEPYKTWWWGVTVSARLPGGSFPPLGSSHSFLGSLQTQRCPQP